MINFENPLLPIQKVFTSAAPLPLARPASLSCDHYQPGEEGAPLLRMQDMLSLVKSQPQTRPDQHALDATYNGNDFVGHAGKLLEAAPKLHVPKQLSGVFLASSLLAPQLGASKIGWADQDHPIASQVEGLADLADSGKDAAKAVFKGQAVENLGKVVTKAAPAAEEAVRVAAPIAGKVLTRAANFIGPVGHGIAFCQRGSDMADSYKAQQQLDQNHTADHALLEREKLAQTGRMVGMGASAGLEGVAAGLSIWGPPGALAGVVVGGLAFGVEMATRALTDDQDELRKKGLLSG